MSISSTSNSSHEQLLLSLIPACSTQGYITDRGDVGRSFRHEESIMKSQRNEKDLSFPRIYRSPRMPQVAHIPPLELMKTRLKVVYRLSLEFAFWKSPYPSRANKLVLAKALHMTYKQINIWFQNRRDRHKGGNEFNIDQTTTIEQLRNYIQYLLYDSFHQESGESRGNHCEVTCSETKRITNSTFLPHPPSAVDDRFPTTGEEKTDQTIDSSVFSFPKPNWLRKPSQRASISERNAPVTLDGLVSRFDSCHVDGSSKTIPVQEPPPPQQVAEEPTKSSNPFAGRILKNLPRRRLPKHAPVSQEKCEPSRKIRPLPRRASPFTDSSVSEPSDEESFTSVLSSNISSSNESLQDATSRTLTITHSPIEKVLSWRKKNSVSMFNL